MASQDKETEILKIIETLTTTGKRNLDDVMMKKLKNICKSSDVYVNYVYYALMTQLRKNHSEIRYSALLITNELFCRSSAFRKLLELDLEEFLQLVAETDLDNPLPLPQAAAKELKIKGLEFMQSWCTKFGEKYTRLQLALTYLKKCKKVDFNDMEARSVAQRERQRREQERMERVVNDKVEKVKKEMQEVRNEISSVVTQMENCFRLLIPHPAEFFSPLDFEKTESSCDNSITNTNGNNDQVIETDTSFSGNEPEISINENSLRHHGLYDMKNTITVELKRDSEVAVHANEDTLPIIENLKDLHKQVITSYLPIISKWTKILTKGSNCSDFLKQAIDLRQVLESSLEKYKELNIKPHASEAIDEDEEDDDFEEVKDKEDYEEVVQRDINVSNQSFAEPSCSKNNSNVEGPSSWQLKYHDDLQDPTSASYTIDRIIKKYKSELPAVNTSSKRDKDRKNPKSKLLETAPVLPYDIDLYHWEDEKPLVPEVIKFDSLHKFWETKNDDDSENEALKEVQRASLRTRKIDFSGKFEPVKWSCRAPLLNGKLCPRKDRYKCPFHGKIIKRDAVGAPVDVDVNEIASTSQTSSAVPDWQDPELLGDIEAATGINLKIPQKRKKTVKKGKGKKKNSGLTNIKNVNNSVRDRLSKKILKRYKHYASKLDEMERKKFNDKFGDQWNYY